MAGLSESMKHSPRVAEAVEEAVVDTAVAAATEAAVTAVDTMIVRGLTWIRGDLCVFATCFEWELISP